MSTRHLDFKFHVLYFLIPQSFALTLMYAKLVWPLALTVKSFEKQPLCLKTYLRLVLKIQLTSASVPVICYGFQVLKVEN